MEDKAGIMFQSILFKKIDDKRIKETLEEPACFVDLNLDQIVDSITAGKPEYTLKPLFYTPLKDIGDIKYRQEIAQDIENGTLLENMKSFSLKMATVSKHLATIKKLEYKLHREGWFLEAVDTYSDAVNCLIQDLSQANLHSEGLSAFLKYLQDYSTSSLYKSILEDTKKLKTDLSTVKYCIFIKGNSVKVRKYQSEIDYSLEVAQTFEKFKQGNANDYRNERFSRSGMNPVEAEILRCVAKLYPDIFSHLNRYCEQYADFVDETLSLFSREVQFYISFLDYIAGIKQAGLKFCYPQIIEGSKEVLSNEGFNLALAEKRIAENSPVVCNDFYLCDQERSFIVSGPDQGGKSTFARTFGQLHYLASLGCPVPGREARLCMWDRLFTLFEKEEDIKDLRSKLEDDLVRLHNILNQATSNSILIINKILTSTTLQDAVLLSEKIVERMTQLDLLCVWVTPLEELASFGQQTVSMVSTVAPENPAIRTYKIVRKPASGLSYAISIAQKYRVTYECLLERIKS